MAITIFRSPCFSTSQNFDRLIQIMEKLFDLLILNNKYFIHFLVNENKQHILNKNRKLIFWNGKNKFTIKEFQFRFGFDGSGIL